MDVLDREARSLGDVLAARAADTASVPLGMRAGVDIVDMPPIPDDCGHRLTTNYVHWNKEYFSPRHRHTFDQIRYVISGHHKVGSVELGPQDVLYVPEGAFYGPQRVSGEEPVSVHVNIQFPGPSRGFYPTPTQQRAAAAQLAQEGTFRGGLYTPPGEATIDGFEAVHERITGKKPDYPANRVAGPIVFHTSAISWRPLPGCEGATIKHVAYLNDVGPNVKIVRLPAGGTLPPSRNSWEEVRFVIEGEVVHKGETYAAPSGFFCPDYLHFEAMSSTSGATIVIVQIARDWQKAPPFLGI